MKIKRLSLFVVFFAVLIAQPIAVAAGTTMATERLAEIVLHMKGQPNNEDKITLEEISIDSASTTFEKKLAAAILRIDQKIHPDDNKNIMEIWISPMASGTERSIAKALLKFSSTIDKKNREVLGRLITAELPRPLKGSLLFR